MRNFIIYCVTILFMSILCSCAGCSDQGRLTDWRENRIPLRQVIDQNGWDRQEQQKRIEAEQQQKYEIKEAEQKRIEEQMQIELKRQAATESALQKRYLDECFGNKNLQDFIHAKNYDEILNNIYKHLKESPKSSQFNLSKITRENMAAAIFIYGFLEELEMTLDDFLHSAEENNITNSEIYKTISSERIKVINLRAEVYQDAYSREKAAFKKLTGYVFYNIGTNTKETATLLCKCLIDPRWEPEAGYIYAIGCMQAVQTVGNEGILMTMQYPWAEYEYWTRYRVFYLNTGGKSFVDGQGLQGLAYYTGTYQYQSITGPRNVYAFKLFNYQNNQIANGKQFYFYPNVIDISGIVNRVYHDAFGNLKLKK